MVLHELAHERGAPRTHLAHHQQVVARHRHAQAKTGGGFGTLLADPSQRALQQFACAGKTQAGRVHTAQQIVGFKSLASHGLF